MYDPQITADRIKLAAKQKNFSVKILLEDLGLSKNLVSSMQSRGSWPQANNLAKVADYLDCSVDFLLGRSELVETSFEQIPKKEKRLISAYRNQPDIQLAVVRLLGLETPLHLTSTVETKAVAFGGDKTTIAITNRENLATLANDIDNTED